MRRAAYVAVTALGITACAAMPQPAPVLGAPGKRLAFASTWGMPYVPTRATVSGPEMPTTVVERRYGTYETGRGKALIDPRLSFAHRITDRLHWSGYLSWGYSGLELRGFPLGDLVDTPVVVSVGGQLDAAPGALLGPSNGVVWDARAQLSAHPTVAGVQLLFGAGLSAGRQVYDIYVPPGPLGGAHEWFPSFLDAARVEARLEGVAGISVPVGRHRFAVAVQPYRVVVERAVSTLSCNACDHQLHVDAIDAPWGVAATFTWLVSVP